MPFIVVEHNHRLTENSLKSYAVIYTREDHKSPNSIL